MRLSRAAIMGTRAGGPRDFRREPPNKFDSWRVFLLLVVVMPAFVAVRVT